MSGGYMPGSGDGAQYADEFSSDGWSTGGYSNGSCSSCGDPGCCDDCEYGGETGCDSSWWDCCGIVGGQPRWYFMADYLYVRASFSEAVAYIERGRQHRGRSARYRPRTRTSNTNRPTALAAAIGLVAATKKSDSCSRGLSSGADDVAPQGIVRAVRSALDPIRTTFINADVDVKSFDLDFRKTIPLGGPACCELRRLAVKRLWRFVWLRRRLLCSSLSSLGHHLVRRRAVCGCQLESLLRYVL